MEIKIDFPQDRGNIEQYLKQLELCVHHAQKALKSAKEDYELSEDQYVCFEQRGLESALKADKQVDLEDFYTEQQDITLVMNIQ